MNSDFNSTLGQFLTGTLSPAEAFSAAEEWLRECPSFILPAAVMLERYPEALTPEKRAAYLSLLALCSPDELTLSRLSAAGSTYANFYPKEEKPSSPTTEQTIDTFLATYSGATSEENSEEVRLLEKLIFNPVPQDYAETLCDGSESSSGVEPDETLARINSFIEAHPSGRTQASAPAEPTTPPRQQKNESEPPASELLSESLAKIYIKQHRYDKAYEIINQLSLNYPEKSVYFADQLRFLRKLLLVESYRKRKNSEN